jgi:hypothetical protein
MADRSRGESARGQSGMAIAAFETVGDVANAERARMTLAMIDSSAVVA